jgi:hypothetical protein
MTPAESGDRFPDFPVNLTQLGLQEVTPPRPAKEKLVRPAPR